MLFLVLNILFASAFMLLIKWAQIRGKEDVVTIGTINYVVAAVLIAPFFALVDRETVTWGAMVSGGTMGLAYFVAYFFVIYVIRWVGAASATVISVLSLLVPIGFGIFWWGDRPTLWQVAGVVLAVTSLMLIGAQKKESSGSVLRPWFASIVVALFFVLCGLSRLAQEAFRHWCTDAEIMTFNFSAFAVAGLPSIAVMLGRACWPAGRSISIGGVTLKQEKPVRISRTEFAFGFAMGAANFLQTQFILESLQRYEGFIVFPVVSAGGILLTTLVATQTLGEKLTTKSYVGIAIAAASLVLLKGFG